MILHKTWKHNRPDDLGKTGILILISVCAQNSCRIWKIFSGHHQNRQYILLFGTKNDPNTVYWFLQRTLGLLWFFIHAIILSFLRKNHWPNLVSELFSMFCHQIFVNAYSR